MMDTIANVLSAFAKDHPILSALLVGASALTWVEWMFSRFVTWTHKMRLHWRRLLEEPNPKVLHH
jgi:hypothetical protein